ncbi:hypothetical protein D3C78_1880830 [compost metagenome]
MPRASRVCCRPSQAPNMATSVKSPPPMPSWPMKSFVTLLIKSSTATPYNSAERLNQNWFVTTAL